MAGPAMNEPERVARSRLLASTYCSRRTRATKNSCQAERESIDHAPRRSATANRWARVREPAKNAAGTVRTTSARARSDAMSRRRLRGLCYLGRSRADADADADGDERKREFGTLSPSSETD